MVASGQWTTFEPDTASGWNAADFERYVVRSEWTFARTMSENPHEYSLRSTAQPGEFDRAVRYIREHGHMETYFGKPYKVLHFHDHKYWTMGAALTETILINRKVLEQS